MPRQADLGVELGVDEDVLRLQIPVHNASAEWDHIAFFNRLAVYHKSPDSGERQYKSRT